MGNERRKVRRISAGEGMVALAKSIETSFEKLKDILDMVSTTQRTPSPCSGDMEIVGRAIEAIERDEGFSDVDFVNAALVIENTSTAKKYLSIKNKEERKLFLLHRIEKFKTHD
jgi:hypothetical protein